MRPYNEKVWAHPVSSMGSQWMAERVASVDSQHTLRSAVERTDDEGWGPNSLYAFVPSHGGTGEIYRRAAEPIEAHIRYSTSVVDVDAERHIVATTDDGQRLDYDHLVWTGPLDVLIARTVSVPDDVRSAAVELVHNSVAVVGIGYESPLVDERSWLYFPEPDVPFYRATNFAKYAAANVPDGRTDRFSSWMTEGRELVGASVPPRRRSAGA